MLKRLKKKQDDTASVLTKRTGGEKVLFGVVFVVFLAYSFVLLYPLIFLLINSFQDALTYVMIRTQAGFNPFSLPETWHWENYAKAMNMHVVDSMNNPIYMWQMIVNSIWFCVCRVLFPVFTCCCTGYALSKYDFRGKELIYTVIIFTMTVPIIGNGASALKLAHDLGYYNNPIGELFIHFTGYGFNFMVMYAFFKNISWSYAEAVFIDGGNNFTAFFKVMLPQAKMAIITLCVITFITVWNDYQTPLLMYPDHLPLAAGLYRLKLTATRSGDYPYYYAGLMISTIPLIAVYASCSDIIFKNFSVGGLKG